MKKGRIKKRGAMIIMVLLLIAAIGSVLFLLPKKSEPLPKMEDACSSDAECVPSSCCHATSCIAKSQAPQCTGIRCTQVCAPGSLDCGQASCGCVNKKCQVVPK